MAAARDVFEKGMQLLASGQEELGIQFLKRAVEQDPLNTEMIKSLGEELMEQNTIEEAKSVFIKCSELDPTDFSLYMYLGQMESGKEALRYYERGIELLGKEDAEVEEIARQLCLAYCAVAELFMSDLCYEEDAEESCENNLRLALDTSGSHPQALQGLATLRLSQGKPEDAKPLILEAFTIIEELLQSRDDDDDDDDDDEMRDTQMGIEEVEALLPPYEFRACTCRLLIEIGEFERAMTLLESLLNENDEIAEVWMLLGQCFLLTNKRNKAIEHLNRAKEVCEALIKMDQSLASDPQFSALLQKIETFKTEAQ